jgi:hypothetical protein
MSLVRVSRRTNDNQHGRNSGAATAARFLNSRTKIQGSQAFSLQGNPKSVAPPLPVGDVR